MIRSWLRRLLPILAIVGMILAPVAAPAGIGAMAAESMTIAALHTAMSDAMPCCPYEKPDKPDCQKSCPLMALCMAKSFPNGPTALFSLPPAVIGAKLIGLRAEMQLASLAPSPPTRPPRA